MNPPPKPPRPSSVPPTEVTVDFDPWEQETPNRPVKLVRYQQLVAVVDHLSDKRADDLTEVACIFADATEDERDVILRVVRAVPKP